MIINPELVKRIKEYFNLNIYETKVWLALLSKGIASAGEIAEISGVPRSRTYDVLESLEKRGFAIVKIGKPVKYISVKPTEVIEKMKSKTLQEAQDKISSLSNLKDTKEYTELEQLHTVGISGMRKPLATRSKAPSEAVMKTARFALLAALVNRDFAPLASRSLSSYWVAVIVISALARISDNPEASDWYRSACRVGAMTQSSRSS